MSEEQQALADFEAIWRVWGLAKCSGPVQLAQRLRDAAIKAGYPAERLQVLEGQA